MIIKVTSISSDIILLIIPMCIFWRLQLGIRIILASILIIYLGALWVALLMVSWSRLTSYNQYLRLRYCENRSAPQSIQREPRQDLLVESLLQINFSKYSDLLIPFTRVRDHRSTLSMCSVRPTSQYPPLMHADMRNIAWNSAWE